MSKPGKMYAASNIKAKVVRDLDPGMTLYPSGDKDGIWWKVTDQLDQRAGCPRRCSSWPNSGRSVHFVEPQYNGVRIAGAAA